MASTSGMASDALYIKLTTAMPAAPATASASTSAARVTRHVDDGLRLAVRR